MGDRVDAGGRNLDRTVAWTVPEREPRGLGRRLSAVDDAWFSKADKVGLRQLLLPNMRRNTVMATFVATANLIAFSTVGLWMPLFLKTAHGWSTAE